MKEKLEEHIKKNFINMSLRLALYTLAWIGIIYFLYLLMPEKGTLCVIMWWVATALWAGICLCDGLICTMHWFWNDIFTIRTRNLKNFGRYKPICKYCNPPIKTSIQIAAGV